MKRQLFLILFTVLAWANSASAQTGCSIILDVIPPVVCPGNTLCVPYTISPSGCVTTTSIRIEIKKPGDADFCQSPNPYCGPGNCFLIPGNAVKGIYSVRLRSGNTTIISGTKEFEVDSLDLSPAPVVTIAQLAPIRPSYCPTDTVCFKISSLSPLGQDYNFIWTKNDTTRVGQTDSSFCYTGINDGDFITVRVTKTARCARFAEARADSIKLATNKKPKVKIHLLSPSTGCENTLNRFVAKVDSAGPDPLIIWTHVTANGRIDTLLKGINDTIFTLPTDSANFGDQVCVTVVAGRCKLKAKDCYSIKACGQVFLDPPIDATICAGTRLRVPYTISGSFLASNVFSVQLSDSLGNFSAPVNIGNLTSNVADTIDALIPDATPGGSCYKIRIISSLPIDTSDSSSCIRVFPKPLPPTTIGDSVCKSGLVTLTAFSAIPGSTYQWFTSPFGGNPVFTGSSWSLSISRDTTFYVSTLSPNGCSSNRVPVSGIISPVPEVEAGPDVRVCIGTLIVTTNPFPVGGTWTGGLPVLNGVIDLTGVAPGIYIQKYSFTNQFGCQSVDSFKLTVVPRPIVNAGADREFCENGLPALLSGNPLGGIWTGNGVQSDGTFVPVAAGIGIHILVYTVTEEGCSKQDTLIATVKPAPGNFTVTTTNPSACGAADGTATITGIVLLPTYKVKWSVATADSNAAPTISSLLAGSYTVQVIDTLTGCSRSTAFGLSDPTAVQPVISGLGAQYCSADDTVTMTATPATPVGTFAGSGVVGNLFIPSQASIGPNVITYSYDAGGGCTGSTSVTVEVNLSPVVNAGAATDTACSDAAPFLLTGFAPTAPPAVWGPSPIVSAIGLVNPAMAANGVNVLTISRTVGSCTSTDTRNLFIYQKPIPVITREPSNSICEGGMVTLTSTLNAGVTATRYVWFKNNAIIPNENGPTLVVTTAGTYKVLVTSLGDCASESNSLVINFNALPNVVVSPSGILTPCANNLTTLTADSAAGYTFQWFMGQDSVVNETLRTYIPIVSGQYRVRVRNAQGCEKFSAVINVTILDAPVAPIISPPFADTCLQVGQPITITIGASGSGLTFEWYKVGPPDQVIPGENGPVITLNQAGQYYAKVQSSNGCSTNSAILTLKQAINIVIADTTIEVCQGAPDFAVPGLSPGGVNCQILREDGTVLTGNFFPTNPGNYTLTYRCTNTNGCVSRKNLVISVKPKPQAVIVTQGPSNACQGDTVRVIVNDALEAGFVYQLIRNDIAFGPVTVNPIIPVTLPGRYKVRVNLGDCSSESNEIIINFRKKPLANAGADLNGCSPLVQNINGAGVTPGGTWSGSPRVSTAGDYNSGDFIGCETLFLQIDSLGCSSFDSRQICIDSIPDFNTAVLDASACQTADGSAWVINPTPGNTYSWVKVGETNILSTTDSLKNVLPGAYSVTVTKTNSACSVTKPAIINSPNNLDVTVLGLPDSVCANVIPFLVSGNPAGGIFTSIGNRITPNGTFDPSLPGPVVDTVYYTITVNGCVGTGKKAIKINSIPMIDAGIDAEVCYGDTLILKAVQPTGVGLIWIGNQVQDDSLYIASDPGITSTIVSFGYTLNGCSAVDSKIIRVNTLPEYSVITNNVTQCGSCNGSAQRSIANEPAFQQVWRNVATNQIVGGGPSVANLCVGVYSIEVTNNTTACSSMQTFGISGPTNINPFVCLGTVPVSICQNEPPVTIQKCSPSASVYIGGNLTDILNPAAYPPDNITVLLTDTDANGCIGVEQKVVEVKAAPIVNVAGVSPQKACTNESGVQLASFFPAYDASVPENGWTALGAPANFITKSGLINATVISQDDTIKLVYTSKIGGANGCVDRDTVDFYVYKTPIAAITPDAPSQQICDGTSFQFCSQNHTSGYTYKWFLGNQSDPPAIGFDSCLNASLPGIYRLQVENNGCKSNLSGVVLLNITPAPIIVSIGSTLTLCQGALPFEIEQPTVTGSVTSSSWTAINGTPGNFISPAGLVTPANGVVGPPNNLVRYVVSNGNCSDEAIRQININPVINSSIQVTPNATEICDGDSVQLIALAADTSYTYEWTKNGIVMPGITNDTIYVSETGDYQVRVLVNGNATCSQLSSQMVSITVKPSPTVSIAANNGIKVCFPGPLFEIGERVQYEPSDGSATWGVKGGFTFINGFGNIRPDSIKEEGTYRVYLTKTIGSCTRSDTLNLIARKVPDATFTASAQAICNGESVTVTYNNPNNYLIAWKLDDSYIGNTSPITFDAAGVVTLEVNNDGCLNSSNSTFEVRPNPTFTINGDTGLCKNTGPVLFTVVNPSPGNGAWSGVGIGANGVFNPQSNDVPASGVIPISYTRVSQFGCQTTKTFNLTVYPVPDITITADKEVIEIYGPAVLTATGGVKFEWSPTNTLSSPTGPSVSASPGVTTTYNVTVTTDRGCVGTESKEIIVDQEFKIYDGLSPNGDQQNDVWIIKNIQKYPNATVKIFNRWGNLIFESDKGYTKPWDGTHKGDPVPPGAYYYVVDTGDPELNVKSGSITVVR